MDQRPGRGQPPHNLLIELSTGLNRPGQGQNMDSWIECAPQLVVTNDGVVGLGARHAAHFAANLNTRAAIQVRLPDSGSGPQWFKCHLLGLAYEDPATNVLIATVKDSIAQVVGNQVVYVDAFDGVRADVRLTYSAAGVTQEILLREQMPGPDAWGLNPASARLTAITEVVEGPPPQVTERVWPAGGQTLRDQTLDFGPMRLVPGRGFGIRGGNPSQLSWVPVTKEYGTVQGRRILLEQLRYSAIQDELLRLPAPGTTTNSPTGASLKKATRWLARRDAPTAPPAWESGRLARGRGSVPADLEIGAPSAGRSAGLPPALRPPSPSLAERPVGPRRSGLANPSAWLATLPPAPPASPTPAPPARALAALAPPDGFLLDWNLVNRGPHDFTFACAARATYLVRGELHLSGTTTFSPGAVLKYYAGSALYLDGPLNFATADPVCGSAQALLTSVNDRSAGELLPSRAPAWEGEFGPALVVGPGDYAPALPRLEARYARPGIIPNDPTTLPAVSVAATAPQARRGGARAGAFTIRRAPGDWSQPLAVRFRVAGSAQPGVDFQDPGATATIPAHQGSVAVAVRPLAQGAGARAASVLLTLNPRPLTCPTRRGRPPFPFWAPTVRWPPCPRPPASSPGGPARTTPTTWSAETTAPCLTGPVTRRAKWGRPSRSTGPTNMSRRPTRRP